MKNISVRQARYLIYHVQSLSSQQPRKKQHCFQPMAKLPTTTRRSTNLLLRHIADHLEVGDPLPTELRMTALGQGSRTAVRSALAHFVERGLIRGMKDRHLCRKPVHDDYFEVSELHSNTES